MAEIQDFQNLVLDANEVVEFKLIRSRSDLENEKIAFHPLMAHQIFGESESIFGYQDLKVRILYTAETMHIYLGIEYGERVDELSKGVIKADDVVSTIAEKLPDGCYFVNMDEFLKNVDVADKFRPLGEMICEFSMACGGGKIRYFEYYHCNYKHPAFLKFFSRLQTFVLWFIDAATYVDVDDPQWSYFVCYEKYKNSDGAECYGAVGYTTVYEYYAYPEHKRPRISQMLVLPPYQKLGIASTFLERIGIFYQAQKQVRDITVEVPSDDFQHIRNIVDCRACLELKSFQKDELKKGFSKKMMKEAREVLKINPRQCRRVYEILRLFHTNTDNVSDYKMYRLDVKKRLNAVYQKQMNDIRKMERAKMDTEWLRARLPSVQMRSEQLQEEYEQLEQQYQRVIERVEIDYELYS